MKSYVPYDQTSITTCIASVIALFQPLLFRAVPNYQKSGAACKVCLFEFEASQKIRKTLQLKEHIFIEIDTVSNLRENIQNLSFMQ